MAHAYVKHVWMSEIMSLSLLRLGEGGEGWERQRRDTEEIQRRDTEERQRQIECEREARRVRMTQDKHPYFN